VIPGTQFTVLCRRDGDATDVLPESPDLAFDVFLNGIWVAGTGIRGGDSKKPKGHLTTIERYVGGLRGITRNAGA
jgi:hypothetical protein